MNKFAAEFLPNGEVVELRHDEGRDVVTLFNDMMSWDWCFMPDSCELSVEFAKSQYPELFHTRDSWNGPESLVTDRFLVHVYP